MKGKVTDPRDTNKITNLLAQNNTSHVRRAQSWSARQLAERISCAIGPTKDNNYFTLIQHELTKKERHKAPKITGTYIKKPAQKAIKNEK